MASSSLTFYRAGCCVSRRAWLRGAGAMATAWLLRPAGEAGAARESSTATSLRRVVERYAADPTNPWAAMHGVRGLGREFALTGAGPAVRYLLEHVVRETAVNGRTYLAVDEKAEGHTNVLLKTLLEAGVPDLTAFRVGGRGHTLGALFESARALFRFNPADDATIRTNLAWSLIAFSQRPAPVQARWDNAWGETVDLEAVIRTASGAVGSATEEIVTAREQKRGLTRKPPIDRFTCGGTHMLYALLACRRAGLGGAALAKAVEEQMDLLFYRLSAEVALIEAFYAGLAGQGVPRARWLLHQEDAVLKFVGHAAEVLGYAALHGFLRPTTAQRKALGGSLERLGVAVAEVGGRDLGPVRSADRDLFQTLVGDAAHATRGLRLLGEAALA